MFEFLDPLGTYIVPYTPEIAIACIACLLVMLGGEINQLLRRLMAGQHFVIRTIAFILLNAFGYGLIIIKVSPLFAHWLRSLDPGILFLTVFLSFIIIGVWAQKKRHV